MKFYRNFFSLVYVQFVNGGEVNTRFFKLTELHGGTADAILDTILHTLEQKRLPIEKAYGIATDGPSVIIAIRRGVTIRMKERNPIMLSAHCIAHRLALASGQTANQVPCLIEKVSAVCQHDLPVLPLLTKTLEHTEGNAGRSPVC